MIVQDVLARKGREVVTVPPATTVADLVSRLAEHGIGALVVSDDGIHVDGIVSERDVTRGLQARGPDVLAMQVRELMTADVQTCGPGDRIRDLAAAMTEGHFRHLPVVEDGALIGIVSIGDIVKSRIDELETETEHLMDYLASP